MLAKMTELINALSVTQDPWCIVAGAATALHTGDWSDVRDIDVVVSLPDAHRLIARSGFIDRTDGGNDAFRSKVYATRPGPVEIDIFADFEICTAVEWSRIDPVPVPIETPAGTIYVPEVREQLAITRMLGRAKDGPRIIKLEKLLRV
jgi:hypothetical protein